jgi:N-acetylmuramoyl-L-alanine amidase
MSQGRIQPIEAPSPNHGPRRGVTGPDMVILHYTAMHSAEAALERLRDPSSEVSAHYLIAEDGRLWRLVAEDRRAWHAGVAAWGGEHDLNSRSIGVELANTGDVPFAAPQMAALEALLANVLPRQGIPPARVLGHQCIAPARKQDPGRRFDWRRLARRGLSVWLDWPGSDEREADARAFRRAAWRFGYEVPQGEGWCPAALATAEAFRARFRPVDGAGGPLDAAGLAHLEALAARWPARIGPAARH